MASDQEWQQHGACRSVPVDVFFPAVEQDSDSAKLVCAACSVQEECLEFAIAAGERFGVWGGLDPQERRTLVARRRARLRATAAALEAPL